MKTATFNPAARNSGLTKSNEARVSEPVGEMDVIGRLSISCEDGCLTRATFHYLICPSIHPKIVNGMVNG